MMNTLPKVVLHEHVEGSVTPEMALVLANKYGVSLPAGFFYGEGEYDANGFPNGRYHYDESDFGEFISTYDVVSGLVREPEDYYLIVKDYLLRNSQKGMVYCELITSAHHLCFTESGESESQLDCEKYHRIMNAIDQAILDVRQQCGTETRLHACAVRHLDKQDIERSARFVKEHPRAMVTGFNIAGNESSGRFSDFAYVHDLVDEIPLSKSYHAGEICGPESIRGALACGAQRIGHGIAAIKDESLLAELITNDITLEISPSSNRILVPELNQSLERHPLRKIYERGVRVSINTDDAGLFGTDIRKEYDIAAEQFGFSRVELLDITLCALEAAFIDDDEKQKLIDNVYQVFTEFDEAELKQTCFTLGSGALYDRLAARLERINLYRKNDDNC